MTREPLSFRQTVWAVALGQILAGVLLFTLFLTLAAFGGLARLMLSAVDYPRARPFDQERYDELFQQELERIRKSMSNKTVASRGGIKAYIDRAGSGDG